MNVTAEEHKRCNCEREKCDHEAGSCKRNATGGKKAIYVGAICKECAKHMPEKYLKD